MRIALVASSRHPIREPFAGGLEAHTWALADGLLRRGHEVSLFAAPGTDPALGACGLQVESLHLSPAARRDVSMVAEDWLMDHHAYLSLMMQLGQRPGRFDVVHNNSLHYLPLAMARFLPMPMVTTLHTPPTPWLESAVRSGPCPAHFVAVSQHTAAAWRHVVDAAVIRNGVDLGRWHPGPGGGPAMWFGRIVAEKGTHLAAQAARLAGTRLTLVGPISDPDYFRLEVEPLLGDGVDYVGHRTHRELNDRLRAAAVCLVTPRWDEPYGLVAAESLACGTPVAGFRRGGLPEVVDDDTSRLVEPDDVAGLAATIAPAAGLDRTSARRRAEQACSLERMVDEYERLYRRLAGEVAA